MACSLYTVNSITGDCSNNGSGAFSLEIYGTAPGYTITWINPVLSGSPITLPSSSYTESNLTAGTWTFTVTDSCVSGGNTTQVVNIYISSGTCASFTDITSTTCNLNNGSLTATTSNFYGRGSFYLYDNTNGYITSASSLSQTYVFDGLSAGTYYVVADDGGGCTGKTETCIVKSSTSLNFGIYVVNDAGCAVNSGKLYVTGTTGVPPYTYLWSNGETTSFITGLTSGNYFVTITDNEGCVASSGATVYTVDSIGLGSFTVVNPTCFSDNGELTITVTGGTAPYYYSGVNGTTEISFSNSYAFTGLSGGFFGVEVTDAGLCKLNTGTSILTPRAFSILSITTTDTVCGNSTGRIEIDLLGGTPQYTYSLSGTSGVVYNVTQNSPSLDFTNLTADTYTLTISDNGSCVYTNIYTINTTNTFTLSILTTGTTCNGRDGKVDLTITSGGTPPYQYQIDGEVFNTSLSSHTFTGLFAGNYTASVIDSTGCLQIQPFTINNLSSIDFSLFGTDTVFGLDGSIQTFITEGEPPFVLDWSNNVNGQTGLTVTGLSAGAYTLTITDNDGCKRTRKIEIGGTTSVSSYQIYNVCDTDFDNLGQLVKKGPFQMLNEGFYDLTLGDTNCVLSQATFIAQVEVSGITGSTEFWVGYDLGDYPGDNEWYDVIKELLLGFDIIADVVVDPINNTILIISTCEASQTIIDTPVKITLKIEYNISCVSCGNVTPTPTPTPTNTTTPTITPTPTVTPTMTPNPASKQFQNGQYFDFMGGVQYEFQN
jgi:hypothetical protein